MTPTIELICGHRSIRHFTDEPISEAQREAIINSARATSSSSFLQCSSIIRITDKALREELVTLTGGQKHVALRPEKIMLCEEPPANGCNFAVGEVIHIAYLGDLSVYHVRLKSGQMISAQLQNAHRHRKGLPTWGDEVRLCWEVDSCVVLTV
ncbi:TOBE domain-containing protein [Escherichia coli]|uniref:TOBE domain-containing protein n=1 Tax=Escherichia coli TaxID=562 RepID=UPI000DF2F120|nr:TOBE domain-containing protein [Escherichia coli]RCX60596.1 TOBE domain-containing protein [Escherichia coli]RCY40223.1 TOBE domain-containing protein [Escherichia coli]RCY50328.1 TOBE domain-containing protein [Escherichia coli]RCY55623.1 TOBE domain-containing protein [Escherichia coli]RCY60110.1 TOBE domain-containing protein [Escherichia coli]